MVGGAEVMRVFSGISGEARALAIGAAPPQAITTWQLPEAANANIRPLRYDAGKGDWEEVPGWLQPEVPSSREGVAPCVEVETDLSLHCEMT